MADDIDDASFWKIQLQSVERLTDVTPGAAPEADGENVFMVEFKAIGPNLDADLEVMVSDIGDESQVVVEALDRLQDGLEVLVGLLARRKGADRIEPTEG